MVTAKHAARLSKIVSRKNFLFAFAQEMRSSVQQPIEDQAANRVAIPNVTARRANAPKRLCQFYVDARVMWGRNGTVLSRAGNGNDA